MKKICTSGTKVFLFVLLCSLTLVPAAHATNGMNMEGYGPIATGMGGASMAYDNGTAAMMNNPATLSLMEGPARLDLAVGFLGPNITTSMTGMPDAKSSADLFMMPAFGYARKSGQFTYGAGVFAQGGMGTEYAANSFLAAGSNEKVRSEVSMGRFLIPVAYQVDDKLTIGGSLDFVWASMDLKMAMSGAQFADLATPGQQEYGTATGSLVNTFGTFIAGGLGVNYARFDFSDGSDFSGKAKGTGFAAKIGGTYKIDDKLTIGGAYHSKTSMSDLETDSANVSMNVDATAFGGPAQVPMVLKGKIQVRDFEWPQMIGLGAAYKATSKLMLVADYKWINWAEVMKNFKMTFTADQSASNDFTAAFGPGADLRGQSMDATLFQKWKDQNVFMLGAAYKITDEFTGRAGLNIANNPIPSKYENPLFPAIVKNHVMLGAGYAISKASSIDASFTYAPEVKVTNGQNVTTTHSQMNEQIMYSYRF